MASPAITEARRGIFKLPAELRLQIYEHVIVDFDPTTAEPSASGNKGYLLPLLNTCKMVRNEALDPYLKHIRYLKEEADAKEDAAAGEIVMFLKRARTARFEYGYEEFEKLHSTHEALLERCRKLDEIVAAEEAIASGSGLVVA